MPNIKSAIKRVKTNEQKRANNIATKSAMRTAVKNAEVAIANNSENAKDALIAASVKLNKAANKGLIHKNAAARKQSRLMKKANKLNA